MQKTPRLATLRQPFSAAPTPSAVPPQPLPVFDLSLFSSFFDACQTMNILWTSHPDAAPTDLRPFFPRR
jgi:hypothetical protein